MGGVTDFLLELRSEEIPARMQGKAKEDLARLFTDALAKAGLAAESIETFATPRRLALIAKGLPLATEAVAEETKGPKVGAPPQAMEGFLRKTGLTQDQLVERDGVYFAIVEKAGRQTADVLGEAIPAIIRAFPWPKSQRWGAASASTESLRWVRPLQGIVALLGDDVVPCEIDGIVSGAATMGHRFHHHGPITIGNAGDYIEKLRACHVIVHFSERCAIIRDGAKAAAEAAGLTLVEDEGLVAENAGLTEWPVPMLGRFDPAFLEVPQEVIQLTARVNQKYFVCHDANGNLANFFVCTANIVANDGGAAIVAGNEKVLAARLSDAKFFWEQDLKVALDEQAKKLSQITFHEKLGTVADKVERVAKLARWLVEEGIVKGASADDAERAARLCKADLVTGMVGEFPELQGIMGGYYARAQGESDAVADAIRDHYKPVGQGDDVPTAPVTVAVSLADKLDTLVAFFAIGEKPTGSKDPFALRRAALAIIRILVANATRISLREALLECRRLLLETLAKSHTLILERSWDEEWDELPELYSPIQPEQAEALIIIGGIPESAHRVGYPDGPYIPRGLAEDHRTSFARIPDLIDLINAVLEYLLDRIEEMEKRDGRRVDLIRSVIPKDYHYIDLDVWRESKAKRGDPLVFKIRQNDANGPDDLVRLLARVKALQAFVATDEGVNLLAGYKRAANILKQVESSSPSTCDGEGDRAEGVVEGTATSKAPPSSLRDATSPSQVDGEELALLTALDTAEPKAASAVDAEDFEGAMAALASLRAPIDAFFEGVMVNDPDPAKRAFRLRLLARFRDAVHRVADFSKIEG